jgi:hypothetical protein
VRERESGGVGEGERGHYFSLYVHYLVLRERLIRGKNEIHIWFNDSGTAYYSVLVWFGGEWKIENEKRVIARDGERELQV